MKSNDGSRTEIMPPGAIIERTPDLGVAQQAYAARKLRRTLGIVALAIVIAVIGVMQLGKVDGNSPLVDTSTTTPAAAAPVPTVAPLVTTSTIAATTTTAVEPPKGKGNGKGNGKPKG